MEVSVNSLMAYSKYDPGLIIIAVGKSRQKVSKKKPILRKKQRPNVIRILITVRDYRCSYDSRNKNGSIYRPTPFKEDTRVGA